MRTTTSLLLAAALLGVASPRGAFAACPGACSYPGGGSQNSDCLVEYDGVTANSPTARPKNVVCTDGDPSCDADGIANGSCLVSLRVCVNNSDPGLPLCQPSTTNPLQSVTVKNAPAGSRRYDAKLAAIQNAVNALGLPTSSAACTASQALPVPLRVAGGRYKKAVQRFVTIAKDGLGRVDRDKLKATCLPSATLPGPGAAYAKVITSPGEKIDGELSRGGLGDYLLANDEIQVVIKAPGRLAYNAVGTYGGNIVDADLVRTDGSPERDSFEVFAPGINIENTADYTNVFVLNDGANGQPAVIRATGVDDLLDAINPSSVVAGLGFTFPAAADDKDLPIDIQTDYILEPGKRYVRVETTVTNTSASPFDMFYAEYLNGSGEVELFQDSYGFGFPQVTACPGGASADLCHMVAYSGDEGAAGVSYGYITAGTDTFTTFSTSGVSVALYKLDAALTLVGLNPPNYHLAASGSAGDSVTLTRWFAVGDGTVGSIEDARNDILGLATGTIQGTVTSGGQPVADADVAVLGPTAQGRGATPSVVDHFRTDAAGHYQGTLRPASYTVRAQKDGRLFGTPDPASVTVTGGAAVTADFTLPAPGKLHVTVVDQDSNPIPAKVQLIGFDPTPDPRASSTVLIINNSTGVFGDPDVDGLAYGVADVVFADRNGDTGTIDVEPGTYQLVVSRGPRYSAFEQDVTITAGQTTTVGAQIAEVMPTPGFICGDWHVHSMDSADSEVTKVERVATQLAEGMDFFTPSDHEVRNDFTPILAQMGVQDLIGTAPSAEITTFDYGHFNSWPVTVDPTKLNGGTVDHGRAGPAPGQDFPAYGSYNMTPAEIVAAAHADPKANLIQINHMRSHFNTDGLDIDTAMTPPQSFMPGSARRLDPSIPNYFTDTFDVAEVWIGTDGRTGAVSHFLGENFGDWVNMLNQGILRAGVASSDTHSRRTTNINARTWVASSVTDPGQLAADAEALAANVVAGKALATNAPFFTVDVTTPLGAAGLGIGQNGMVATNDGTATVTVNVKSPLWAQFDTIELYVNAPTQAYDHDGKPSTRDRYRVPTPTQAQHAGTDFTVTTVNDYPAIPGASHLEANGVTFTLTGLTQDAWIIVMVKGTDGVSAPLFPIYPNSLKSSGNTTLANLEDGNVGELGMTALALSDPIYLDVDDDNAWTPPGVQLVP